jgi:Fis family transcriptional regulator
VSGKGDPSEEGQGLAECLDRALDRYFANLEGERPAALYRVVQCEVERVLLHRAVSETAGNQRRAADLLGINRNTLRKKLDEHGIDPGAGPDGD